jgi:hypothetical protein
MRTGFLLMILFLTGTMLCSGSIDSLKAILKISREDTARVNTINHLSKKLYQTDNYDTALVCARSAMELSQKLGCTMGLANAHIDIGIIQCYEGDYSVHGNLDQVDDVCIIGVRV